MIVASTTFRCHGCGQLLPFDETSTVPSACLRRCQGRCDWRPLGPTQSRIRQLAAKDGPVGPDGLPLPDQPPLNGKPPLNDQDPYQQEPPA